MKEKKAKGKYYRKKVRHPVTGEYKDVYGHTRAERDEKADALEAAWAAQLRAAESPYVFQYAADWYARLQAGWSAPRRAEIAREINNNICPVIGAKRLCELTSDDCMDVMAARAGKSKATQEKTLQILRRILKAAVNAGKLPRDPSEGLHAAGEETKEKDALTPDQQKTLLAAVEGCSIELFVKLGLYTGLRREEILGLMWRDVHLDGPAPHLDVRRALRWPKNNRPEISTDLKSAAARRSVPLPPPLCAELRKRHAEDEKRAQELSGALTVVHNADGEPWTYQTFRKAWHAIEARSVREGRPLGSTVPKHPAVRVTIDFDVTPHILRHTYITMLILGGVDVRRAQYLAGHETPEVTLRIYTHLMAHKPEDMLPDVSAVFPG